MFNLVKRNLQNTPIRVRLTLWYLLLAGLAVLLFGAYQYIQLQRSLFASVDTSLDISVSQALGNVDLQNGRLAFQNTENLPTASRMLIQSDFTIRLLAPDGTVLDGLGDPTATIALDILSPGFQTIGKHDYWRVYTQPIQAADGSLVGWLQAIQSLEVVEETLENMRTQLLLTMPLILLLTGMGGVFLANRALRPIDQITKTAEEIGAGDLSHRIDYHGPQDEVGNLAQTFDHMLGRLQAAFERERRFSEDAAHELRTPLTALKGQIEVALSRPREQSEYKSTLQGLISQVDRLIRLSNALLFLSRSDQKRLSWEPALLNLAELLDIIIEQILPLADEHKLSFHSRIPTDLPVYGDTDHLIRLFLNLLDNAVKYTPMGGEINLWASQDPSGVQVVINNSGEGIPPEHLPHLFERFYRADANRSRETGGSGLGLAIAHEIVCLHGGEIRTQSEPGQGTTFTVFLPNTSI